jgi:putative transposase
LRFTTFRTKRRAARDSPQDRDGCRRCGRICFKKRKVNLSQVFAGQAVSVKQVSERVWLVSFMDNDLGFFDGETCRLEPIANPFGPNVLPMSPE